MSIRLGGALLSIFSTLISHNHGDTGTREHFPLVSEYFPFKVKAILQLHHYLIPRGGQIVSLFLPHTQGGLATFTL